MIIINGQARMCDKHEYNKRGELECCRQLAHTKTNEGYKCLKHFRTDYKYQLDNENRTSDYMNCEKWKVKIILEHYINNIPPKEIELANSLDMTIDCLHNIKSFFDVTTKQI